MVARTGVCVLGRDEVYGACKGVSESVPPGDGGALVAAAPLRALPRAFVCFPPIFWWGKASTEIGFNGEFVFLCAHGPVSTSYSLNRTGISPRGAI